jgi:hypothetical protein
MAADIPDAPGRFAGWKQKETGLKPGLVISDR